MLLCISDVTEAAIWNSGGVCHMEALLDLGSLPVLPHSPIFMTIFDVLSEGSNESHVRKLDLLNVCPSQEKRLYPKTWKEMFLCQQQKPKRIFITLAKTYLFLFIPITTRWTLPGVPTCIKTAATGVPDSWNELLYALFLKHESLSTSS
ncbi:PREDICTED: trichome birefringence 10 [Prunus dulcis]|uniref:PREDICTED: trichome birefringence 10 n=2 Tax=Prunus dulcis TaxID=3755 RepID=A0A5E4EE82_PRUDU|nr:PREDICTED: trichome birefringence 10 [Prunus dulcis]